MRLSITELAVIALAVIMVICLLWDGWLTIALLSGR
jgi:hypothetical protein